MLTVTFGYLIVRGLLVQSVLMNAVVVVIAFYFGTGTGQARVAADDVPRRARIGRGAIRVLLLGGFAGLGVWHLRGNLSLEALPPELREVWQLLAGYLLGLSLAWVVHRKADMSALRRRLAILFRHLSAAGALGLVGYVSYAFATGSAGAFAGQLEQVLSLVITYYFGSRVVGR